MEVDPTRMCEAAGRLARGQCGCCRRSCRRGGGAYRVASASGLAVGRAVTPAWVKDRSPVELVDLACFGRPARLVWRKHRWCCPDRDCPMSTAPEPRRPPGPRGRALLRCRRHRRHQQRDACHLQHDGLRRRPLGRTPLAPDELLIRRALPSGGPAPRVCARQRTDEGDNSTRSRVSRSIDGAVSVGRPGRTAANESGRRHQVVRPLRTTAAVADQWRSSDGRGDGPEDATLRVSVRATGPRSTAAGTQRRWRGRSSAGAHGEREAGEADIGQGRVVEVGGG